MNIQDSSSLPSGAKAFVLMEWVPYESSYLWGVYSTRAAAEAAKDDCGRNRLVERANLKVHEIEVDALPEYVRH